MPLWFKVPMLISAAILGSMALSVLIGVASNALLGWVGCEMPHGLAVGLSFAALFVGSMVCLNAYFEGGKS